MKYVKYLRDAGIEHKLIGWDRDGVVEDSEETVYFRQKAGYNVGGMKAALNRVKWMRFVVKTLLEFHMIEPFTIHACDLDAAFPAAVYNKLVSKACRAPIIFDVFDWFSATLYKQNKLILTAFKFMERVSVRNADHIIICEPERVEQIPFEFDKSKLSILPNIPFFKDDSFLKDNDDFKFKNDKLTFSYVGGFSKDRCLFEILNIAEKGLINLSIAGFGLAELEERLKCASAKYDNIRYYGKVDYQTGLNISYNSDIMFAMYSPVNPNNVYAAPNKYYEAMFLGKPIFSSKGTIVEKKVNDRQMGYLAHDNEGDIQKEIEQIAVKDLIVKGVNSKACWQNTYKDYTANFLCSVYHSFIVKN